MDEDGFRPEETRPDRGWTCRVKNGSVDAEIGSAGSWLVAWRPDEGHADYPGWSVMADQIKPYNLTGVDLLRWGWGEWKDR